MSILLPSDPAPQQAVPKLLDWSRTLTPQGGGDLQQLNRLGTRFSIDVTMPRRSGDAARVFLSKLRQAKLLGGAILLMPEVSTFEDVGSLVVDGAGQSGMAITLRGGIPGRTILDGRFFSLVFGGRRYLHHATADTVIGGDGRVTLPILPMLRVQPGDGNLFVAPYIEGFISGNEIAWTLARFGTDGIAFTITEVS